MPRDNFRPPPAPAAALSTSRRNRSGVNTLHPAYSLIASKGGSPVTRKSAYPSTAAARTGLSAASATASRLVCTSTRVAKDRSTATYTNSLVGSQAGDQVGLGGLEPLSNGNYVVKCSQWANGRNAQAGALR